jgi:hypothetical protein
LFIASNPTNQISTTATRNWTDSNRDYNPDCDLLNPQANGECGLISNPNFGSQVASSTIDPSLVSGWGVRSGDWQWGVAVQQQLLPRISAEFGYQRRWLVNFLAVDNLNQNPADLEQFSVIVPSDPRLPGGGGGTVDGVFNATTAAASRLVNNITTLANNYGGEKQASNTLSLNITARPKFGLTVQGGFNYASINYDRCDLRAQVPEYNDAVVGITGINPTNPWCNFTTNLFRATALGSYTVPKVDVQIATTFRSDQGSALSANYTASPSNTTLGRAFSGGSPTITVNLIKPGSLYGDRVNQLDLRLAKIFRFGKTRTNVGVDIYNLLNANPVLTYNEAFTSTWLRPNSVLQPRFAKVSAQFNF